MLGRSIAAFMIVCALGRAQTPVVTPGGVVNAASFAGGQPVAPGSLVSIFGTDLASRTAANDSVTLASTLADVSVTMNNIQAPLSLASSGQINAEVPWDIVQSGSGTATIIVRRGNVSSAPVQVQVAATAPGIFSVQFGTGQAIAVNGDGTLAAPAGSIPGLPTHPAKIGDPGGLIIYATGLGAVDSPIATGAPSTDKLRNTTAHPAVTIGGVPAVVVFSGLSPQFPGVNQVNVFIPDGTPTGDALPLQIQVNGVTTTDKVTLAVGR